MIKVGLTGGIGSGKSFVAKLFEALNIPVYSADKEAKRLMWRDGKLKHDIKNLLGVEAYHSNGRLNRQFIASKVFENKTLLTKLNALVHPAVREDLNYWFSQQVSPYAIQEAALIFETGKSEFFDKIITVVADKELRISRTMKRDKCTRQSVLSRMKNQMPQDQKAERSDYIIDNNGSKSLIQQVYAIHRQLV